MSVSALPPAALVHILQFVPQQQRLTSCALVNTTWAEAAAVATATINAKLQTSEQRDSLVGWISSHGRHVSRVQLTSSSKTLVLPLAPWPALRALHVSGMTLQLAPTTSSSSSSSAQLPPALPCAVGITQLLIDGCHAEGCLQSLTVLKTLRSLQHLKLNVFVPVMHQNSSQQSLWTFPCSIWTALTALTHLDLANQHNVTDAVLQALTDSSSCLTRLQVLRLHAAQLSRHGLQHLHALQHLSTLQLYLAPHIAFSSSSTPWLQDLTCLQDLQLFCWRELQPDLLSSLSEQLRSLELHTFSKCTTPTEAAAFLAALAQLTHLTALSLQHVLRENPNTLQLQPAGVLPAHALELPAAACAALTASSNLHTLCLDMATLPVGAWQQMFSAQRQLPHLRDLHLAFVAAPMGDADLEQLVACCPGLTALALNRVLLPGVMLVPLLQLHGLRQLVLRHVHGDGAAGVLAQLTLLDRLHSVDAHLSRTGLLQLTALRQLTSLQTHCSVSAWDLPRAFNITNKAPEWSAPDVWSQLQQELS